MAYFNDIWNLIDFLNYIIFIISITLFILYVHELIKISDLSTQCQDHEDQGINELLGKPDPSLESQNPMQITKVSNESFPRPITQ